MPKFEFTSPDGQKYEIEGPEGATEEQAFQILMEQLGQPQQTATQQTVAQQPLPQTPPIGERISGDVSQRLQNIAQTARQQFGPGSGPLNTQTPTPFATTALSALGNVAAIPLDVAGEVIKSGTEAFTETFPKASEAIGKGFNAVVRELVNPEAIQSGLQQARQARPTGMQELGNIANVALLATPQAAAARTTGSKLIASSKKATYRNKRQFVDDLLTDPAKDIDKAIFKNKQVQYNLTKQDRVTSAQISRVKGVSPKKNIIQNRNAIQEANTKVISDLDQALKGSTSRINTQGLENIVDTTVSRAVQKDLLLDEPTTASIRRIGEAMKAALKNHPNTPSGLWAARKEFDAKIQAIHPNVYSDAYKPYNYVVQQVRQTMNDFIAASVPDKRIRGMLSESHQYFKALEKTRKEATKFARTEAPGTVEKAIIHALNLFSRRGTISQATKAGTGASIAIASYLAGYPTLAALVGTGTAVLTTGAIAKNIAKSPLTRRAVGEAISLTEKALGKSPGKNSFVKRLRADRAALIELYNNLPEDQNGQ